MSMSNIMFLYPGQGSQVVGMGKSLCEAFPYVRQRFEQASEALGFDLMNICFNGPEEELRLTSITQPALLVTSTIAHDVLTRELGVEAKTAAGHSLGEYSALSCAGGIDFVDAVKLVHLRGKFMQEAVPVGKGAMAAIMNLDIRQVHQACKRAQEEEGEVVMVANYNLPSQVVIAGGTPAVELACKYSKELGARKAVMLPVSAPFHCSLMQSAQDKLAKEMESVTFSDLTHTIINNVDASYIYLADDICPSLVRQVTGTVRWYESMQIVVGDGINTSIELGSGKVLSGMMRKISKDVTTLNLENAEDLKKIEDTLYVAAK
ncbi:ACP S-malonyltransferase [Desulfurispira natronophila]|uniref:Malonyl CoA-acyl carrier protein transacylase n=1 Tax=Desulfurispira natronophila TaxID=682562 RepID=A0A7W8DH83_9BACT|nr:ACP S-malonyltransferase [Desulfurispira natronophila]MBB5022023.1 [acyl-carrier-protein] S-malonyltransferase [Desulfurispira natronophila]